MKLLARVRESVGVPVAGEPQVSLADLCGGGAGRDAEPLVVVGHGLPVRPLDELLRVLTHGFGHVAIDREALQVLGVEPRSERQGDADGRARVPHEVADDGVALRPLAVVADPAQHLVGDVLHRSEGLDLRVG